MNHDDWGATLVILIILCASIIIAYVGISYYHSRNDVMPYQDTSPHKPTPPQANNQPVATQKTLESTSFCAAATTSGSIQLAVMHLFRHV